MDCWREVPSASHTFNFKWMPFLNIRLNQLSLHQKQIVNHFEFHGEVTTKDLLFKNLMAYSELNKINVFDYVPMTFVMDVDARTYSWDFERFARCYEIVGRASQAGEGVLLAQTKAQLQQVGLSKERRAVSHCRPKVPHTHLAGKNLWVLKPTHLNRGRGVTLFNSLHKLKALIKHHTDENESSINAAKTGVNKTESVLVPVKSRTFVVQKYIERPLLIDSRKFDVRVWVLVTHEMKVYFFQEGYIRTSSALYSIEEEAIDNVGIHLTNNAVQKYCPKYGAFENGNQLSFSEFQVLYL